MGILCWVCWPLKSEEVCVCVCVCPKACEALVLGYMTSLEAKKFSFSFGNMYLATISRGDPNTTGDNNVINVYSSDSLALEFQLCGHTDKVTSLCFTNDASKLISGSRDRTIRVWCLSTQSELLTLPVSSTVNSLSVCSERLLTKDCDGCTMIWDLSTGKSVLTVLTEYRFAVDACFSADGATIVSDCVNYSWNQHLSVWDGQTGDNKWGLCSNVARPFSCLAVSPSPCMFSASGMAATGHKGGAVCLWNLSAKLLHASAPRNDCGAITAIAFNSDGTRLATGSMSGKIIVWDTWGPALRQSKGFMIPDNQPATRLAFDATAKRLACSFSSYSFDKMGAQDEVLIFDLEAEDGDINRTAQRLSNCCYATFSSSSLVLM
jgi:WD40 repeat protein